MPTGLVSHIQGYSIKDGPGIRTTVFMTGCNLRCKWCANPESMLPNAKVMYYVNKCQRCGKCAAMAANQAITVTPAGCIIDRERCTNLKDMVEVCDHNAYELEGREYTPEALAARLIRDQAFFEQSGGGVTFSGGEPTLQAAFVEATIDILKNAGIQVALDTAGLFDFEQIRALIAKTDLFLYDIKAYDPKLHQRLTEVDNRIILANARALARIGKPLIIRLVIVPGLNDDMEDIKQRIKFIKSLGSAVIQTDILRFHRLGLGKYRALGIPYQCEHTPEVTDDFLNQITALGTQENINMTIGG